MAISAVLLAYKEAENLKVLLPKIKQQLDKIGEEYEIIIVDTMKSLDDTPAVCKKFGARYVNQRLPHFGGTAAGHRAGRRLCQERHPRSGQPVDRHPCADARGRHAGADRWQVS